MKRLLLIGVGMMIALPTFAQGTGPATSGRAGNVVFGCASATGTSATAVLAAPAAGLRIYITSISLANSGATASTVTIQTDTAGSPATVWGPLMNPAGSGNNPVINSFAPPRGSVAKNIGFTASNSSTTQTVCIAGYTGP